MIDNKTKGALLLIVGCVIFFWGIKDFILPLALTCLGLYMIFYGMRLRGTSPMQIFISRWMRGGFH